MPSETRNPADQLNNLITRGCISEDALHAMTDIQPEKLRSFLRGAKPGMVGPAGTSPRLSADETVRLSILVAYLADGLQVDDDERLKGIFEGLTVDCRLTLANLAHLTGADIKDLEAVLRDPSTVAPQTKYALALKGSYLINAANQARGH